MTTIAVLGTGIMGLPIAANLLDAGFPVRAWNRTEARARPLADRGGVVATTPAEAVRGADIVLTMLADGPAVREVMAGLDEEPGAGRLWIQASTVGARYADEFAGLAAAHDLTYVDAPVLGTRQPAEQGALVVLASGPDDARERCTPVFDAIGSRTRWVGPAGAGSRLKLVVNSWLETLTVGAAEALSLAAALGLDPHLFLDTIRGGGLDAGYVQGKGAAMLAGEFPPSFPLSLAAKDARLVGAAAAAAGQPAPLAAAVRDRYEQALADGHGGEDMAAVYRAYHRTPPR
ncbi:3-hydroxyisobutyrate dehydrogenase [Actinocatenispora thailandica]|uniref:3-hydroxyisobutyrate dehydrogenase n=1 Tax=Actinocatenispora thailandica TaxID=227318 RepID=A0A7R7DVX8_9ACTN|nr:NAD(P)-dependent oxidoreductase [Actinocatenispora thailandica]BCJ38681.1 3-hydroxyisobutyrate dehydrogenase [Actinocatenispora thailandica]